MVDANAAVALGESALGAVQGNITWLLIGLVLVIAAVLVFIFIKNIGKIIVNSVLGVVAWGFAYYILGVKMDFLISLAVSVVFGLAGVGVMLMLKFLGVAI